MKSKIVNVGPCNNLSNTRYGGITIPFTEFHRWASNCSQEGRVDYIRHCLTGDNIFSVLYSYLSSLKYIFVGHQSHVILHLTWRGIIFYTPFILLSKLFLIKTRISIRKFAGDFDQRYCTSNVFTRIMLRLSLKKLEYFFLETKYLCSWASSLGINSYYWPNTRFNQFQPLDFDYRHISCGDLSLVFAGRIAKEKGFYKVASLIEKYPFISVSLFGPIDDDSIRSSINSSNRLKYMGIIPNDQLIRQMRSFDALVLPTSWVAEGYPGVVLEAAFSGVPAIVSKEVRGPVELVEELGAGWVIDFSNSNEIEYALRDLKNNFSHEFRVRLSINVNNKFNSNRVFENIWELLI